MVKFFEKYFTFWMWVGERMSIKYTRSLDSMVFNRLMSTLPVAVQLLIAIILMFTFSLTVFPLTVLVWGIPVMVIGIWCKITKQDLPYPLHW